MMKFRYLLLLSSAFFLFSCDNKVELLEEGASIPIIYGLFNTSVDEQFVSISKSFQFGTEGGALAAAQQEDSLYYGVDEIVAYAENSRTADRTTLVRVNLADQGLPRAEGVFPTNPNYFYTFSSSALNVLPDDTVQLRLEKSGNLIAEGNAPVLPTLKFQEGRDPLDLYPFSSEAPYTFRWTIDRSTSGTIDIGTYEFGFYISLTETGPDGSIERNLYWAAGQNLDGSKNFFTGRIDGFYDFLNGELRKSLDGYSYTVPTIKMVITGGDDSYTAYRDLIEANRGITSTGELPPFTNIAGGIGLFGGITQLTQLTVAGLTPGAADALQDRCPGIDFGL